MKRDGLIVALLIGLAAFLYAGTLPKEFVYDDREGVQENPAVNGELPWSAVVLRDFWGRDRTHTVATYRPVAVAVSRLTYQLGGGSPQAFRVMAVLLHLAVMGAAYVLLRSLASGPVAASTVLMAAFCAASSEAVFCAVGMADVLCALATIVGLTLHRRSGWLAAIGAAVCFVLALGAKETGLMAPVVWLAADLLIPSTVPLRSRLQRVALYGVASVPYFFGRVHAMGALFVPTDAHMRNPLSVGGFLARELGAGHVLLTRYFGGLLLPWRRVYDCSANACNPGQVGDWIGWLGLALWIGLLIMPFVLRRRAPVAALGIAWFVLFFMPGSNFLIAGPTAYGERLLYLPVIGLMLALMTLPRRATWAIAGAFLLLNVPALQLRAQDWQDREHLAQSGARYAQESALVQVNLAVQARPKKDWAAVEAHARRAIAVDAREMPPHRELAAALFATGRLDEARQEFEAAYAIRQDEVLVFDYANYLGRTKEYEQGRVVLERYLSSHPGRAELEELREKLGRAAERTQREKLSPQP